MRNAPSVMYPVGRCAFYARLLLCLAVLGGLAVALGPVTMTDSASRTQALVVGVGCWLLWLGFAVWSWRRTPVGRLHWDALAGGAAPGRTVGAWRWHSDAGQDGALLQRVEPMLDLQTRMLLRLRNPAAATRWVWVEQGRDPARWDDLRRALQAHG
ncbi:MAG: hypothetical protein C0445_09675 [Polaromonas sp.]|nr:hypothetical protein [Polaromonas sp.]